MPKELYLLLFNFILKAKFAQAAEAIGLILYTDPKDYSPVDPSDTYPNSWWMPPTGVQRGTLWLEKGDPLTPGFPSKGTSSWVIKEYIKWKFFSDHLFDVGIKYSLSILTQTLLRMQLFQNLNRRGTGVYPEWFPEIS